MSRRKILIFILFLGIILFPYLYAFQQSGDFTFSGFLVNVNDGNSYIAKMYEGWRGEWNFTLPYTSEPGSGGAIYLYYLFLGHLAKWLGTTLVSTYISARILSAAVLFLCLDWFIGKLKLSQQSTRNWALILCLFGSGLGWIAAISGGFTSDFWVAEAYPFLSSYTNPHFTLGLAILTLILGLFISEFEAGQFSKITAFKLIGLSTILSIVHPFGVVIAGITIISSLLWIWFLTKRLEWKSALCLIIGGGPYFLYQLIMINTDPQFAQWSAQNITTSPPLWDFLVSFLPGIALAGWTAYTLLREKSVSSHVILAAWLVTGVILIYLPFYLQRRFMTGFYIPIAILAVIGIGKIVKKYPVVRRSLFYIVLCLSLPTNLLLLLGSFSAIPSHDPKIFLTKQEEQGLEWIQNNTPPHAVILASPEFSAFIPGFTGRKVVYGHPFETINAAVKKKAVEDFYRDPCLCEKWREFLKAENVMYILWGPREQKISNIKIMDLSSKVFQNEQIAILKFYP